MVLKLEVSAAVAQRLKGARIRVVGGREVELKPGATFVLPNMEPGENRWIGLTYRPPRGKPGEVIAVCFNEVVNGRAINGFGLGARIGTDSQVVRAAAERHRSVLTRLAAGFDFQEAADGAKRAAALAAKRRLQPAEYLRWLRGEVGALEKWGRTLLRRYRRRDGFDIVPAIGALARAVRRAGWSEAAAAHSSVLNRLDAYLTFLQLERGDPADVVQNVRWQIDLYERTRALRRLECAVRVSKRSRDLVNAAGQRLLAPNDYRALIRALLPDFEQTAKALRRLGLAGAIAAMRATDDPAALQKAHREFLLGLDRYARPRAGKA